MAGKSAEEANIAASKSVQITTLSFLINMPKKELEELLKNNDYVDEYEIEDLDNQDIRKEVFLLLKNPVDAKYIGEILLKEILKH